MNFEFIKGIKIKWKIEVIFHKNDYCDFKEKRPMQFGELINYKNCIKNLYTSNDSHNNIITAKIIFNF